MDNTHIYRRTFSDGQFVQVNIDLNDPNTVQISATPYPKEHEKEYVEWRMEIADEMIKLLTPMQQAYVAKMAYLLLKNK